MIEPFADRLVGRYLVEDFKDAEGNVLVSKDKLMDDDDAKIIIGAGVTRIKIRSVLTCRARHGVCAKCYGSNLAKSALAKRWALSPPNPSANRARS